MDAAVILILYWAVVCISLPRAFAERILRERFALERVYLEISSTKMNIPYSENYSFRLNKISKFKASWKIVILKQIER